MNQKIAKKGKKKFFVLLSSSFFVLLLGFVISNNQETTSIVKQEKYLSNRNKEIVQQVNGLTKNNSVVLPVNNSSSKLDSITSVSDLKVTSTKNSHSSALPSSRLELNYREQIKLDSSVLGQANSLYPRIKRLNSSGKYILFYQNATIAGTVRYIISNDSSLTSWGEDQVLFKKNSRTIAEADVKKYKLPSNAAHKYYTTADAVVLSDGKTILATSSFRPSAIGEGEVEYSILNNKQYDLLNKYSGIDLVYSNDGGVTWSKAITVYQGYNWEPNLHVIDDNTVQVYFSQVAISMEDVGIEHSSGVAMVTLTKNSDGTWENKNITPKKGKNYSPTTTVFKFPAKNISTPNVPVKNLGVDGKLHTRMTAQMPSTLTLNNGSFAMVVESMYKENSNGKDKCGISFAFNADPYMEHVKLGHAGPNSMKIYQFDGCSPYMDQFNSGQIVIGYNANGTYNLRLANGTLKKVSNRVYKPLPNAKGSYWGSLEVDDTTNSVVSTIHGKVKNESTGKEEKHLYISRSYLNHKINVSNENIIVDGNASEWKTTNALFIGDETQAQGLYRFANDNDYVYIVSEVLDRTLIADKDYQVFYIGTSADSYYAITVDSTGLKSAKLIENGKKSSISDIEAVSQVLSTNDPNKNGYVTEIKIPVSLFENELDGLRVIPLLFNADNVNEESNRDKIAYMYVTKFSSWMPLNATISIKKSEEVAYLDCKSSTKSVSCDLYLNDKNEKVPDEVTFTMSYDNLTLKSCNNVSGKGHLNINCSDPKVITIRGFNKNEWKYAKVASITLEKENVNKDSLITFNYYNVHYDNNGTKNANWLFIGDSFFDYLDGVALNPTAGNLVDYGYKNYTKIDKPISLLEEGNFVYSKQASPTLGKIQNFGLAGITLRDYQNYFMNVSQSEYFLDRMYTYLKNIESKWPSVSDVKRIAIYLGVNDAAKYLDGQDGFEASDIKKYMTNLITKLNEKYSNPEIYIVKILPRVANEKEIIGKYNKVYEEVATSYNNVSVVDSSTSYRSSDEVSYQLLDTNTGLIRTKYYASSSILAETSTVNAGRSGHFKAAYYKYWSKNLREVMHMNYSVKMDQEYHF